MLERSNKNGATQLDFGVSIRPVTSVGSVQNTPRPKCKYCEKYHPSECRGKEGACYKYGAINHFIRNCHQLQREEEEQKEKQLATYQRSRRSGQNSATGIARLGMKDSASGSEAKTPARQSVIVNLVCRNCPLKVEGCEFPADLMFLPFREFDVILGMDWFTKYDALVNCREKHINLKGHTGEVISVESENPNDTIRIISTFSAQRLLCKGNEAFFAYILDARDSESKLDQLPVVNEFANVFLEELLGLPPDREVEFVIDFFSRNNSDISNTILYGTS
ncbi:uncharacterized protein [Gossypium hirsutum]|uniref:RVP_2 domain-containing protein n=1 Tax=Gossypium hirsutum TaxID=3635 RepID=A0A1U8ISR7_GOSHI|nr:uncharacterized protein LOC107899879 [Gossypium hirsutum]